jgi:hypothetical protein
MVDFDQEYDGNPSIGTDYTKRLKNQFGNGFFSRIENPSKRKSPKNLTRRAFSVVLLRDSVIMIAS